jgi:hypothetical protein
MEGNTVSGSGRHGNPWRIAIWGSAAFLLLLPLVAMRFTEEVNWGLGDFVTFGIMLFCVCSGYELAARVTSNKAYRAAAGVALAAAFLLVWINLSVGIIGSENNPANFMYGGVLATGIIGAIIARFQPQGMAFVLAATALAQALVAVIALLVGDPWNGPLEILAMNGFFVALFAGSAWLFHRAAYGRREQA